MPLIQLALDFIDSTIAIDILTQVEPLIDMVEAGTSMIKREGIGVLESLRRIVPHKQLVADLKTMDDGAYDAELAFDAGADILTVLGCAHDSTILAAIAVANARGGQVMADLIGVPYKRRRAQQLARMGIHYIGVHTGSDEQAAGMTPLSDLALVRSAVSTPLAVAGGIKPTDIEAIVLLSPAVIIVGSYITRAADPRSAATDLRTAINAAMQGV